MEKHNVSSRWCNVRTVPESHIFSKEDRPGKKQIKLCKKIPVIDLSGSHSNSRSENFDTIHKIIKASQEYGIFQVINHGVHENVINNASKVVEELFGLPVDQLSEDARESGWFYMGSTSYLANGAYLWRDNVKHQCHPLQQAMYTWPRKPDRYREFVAPYIIEIRRLSLRILEMISRGLGFDNEYLGEISRVQFLTANNYPKCPDPSLTLGLLKHLHHCLITITLQGKVGGLQLMKDGKWFGVEVVPNAFVINIGTQLEIITNGMLKSPEHRVVTNKEEAMTTITTVINPAPDCIIGPAQQFIDKAHPPLYQPLPFGDFVIASKPSGPFPNVIQHG